MCSIAVTVACFFIVRLFNCPQRDLVGTARYASRNAHQVLMVAVVVIVMVVVVVVVLVVVVVHSIVFERLSTPQHTAQGKELSRRDDLESLSYPPPPPPHTYTRVSQTILHLCSDISQP
jgi:hypothetical protein